MSGNRAEVWAIVVAGGSGTRFGGPKQYLEMSGRRVIDRSVEAAAGACAGVVVVVPADDVARESIALAGVAASVVAGGATRSASVRAGLASVPRSARVIVVHDAARPLAAAALFEAVVQAVAGGADAAVPGVPVTDTIKRVARREDAREVREVLETLDRAELVAVQTPQAFSAAVLRAAHEGTPEAGDDAGLVEARGGRVVVVPGDPTNLKLTTPADVALAAALVQR